MALSLMQLLELVDKAKSQKERGDLLKQNQTDHLENLLWYTFHPDVKFLLPEGRPPFNAGAEDPGSTLLYGQIRKLRYFVEGPGGVTFCTGNTIEPARRETMYISMLESITPREAEYLVNMKKKDLGIRGLTYKLVSETFPHLIPPMQKTSNSNT
tara:strand:- start:1020 stop:1484 length:465 start_codon:yes stop_codon:yes gene_type:complete